MNTHTSQATASDEAPEQRNRPLSGVFDQLIDSNLRLTVSISRLVTVSYVSLIVQVIMTYSHWSK